MIGEAVVKNEVNCFHCGEISPMEVVKFDNKDFCCSGCKAVYELFRETDLQDIYSKRKEFLKNKSTYDYLNNLQIEKELLSFEVNKLKTR